LKTIVLYTVETFEEPFEKAQFREEGKSLLMGFLRIFQEKKGP
jgi:hypothetical protein